MRITTEKVKNRMSSKKVYYNVIWNTFGSIFYSFCQWLMTVVVVHVATYDDAGYLSLAMTTSSSFSAIALFSMRNYQVSDVRGEYSVHEYFGSRIITCAMALITCLAVSFWKNDTFVFSCIAAFMVIRVAEAFADVLHGQNQKYDRYDYIGISYIIRGLLSIALFVTLLKTTGSMAVTLAAVAIANLLGVLGWDFYKTNRLEAIKPVFGVTVVALLRKCIPIVIFSFLLSVENLIPKNVLSDVMGTEALGIYSTVATPTLVVQVFAMVAFNPFLPGISYDYNTGNIEKFRKGFFKLLVVFAISAAAIFAMAALLGRPVLSILFGEQILDYYEIFMPIIVVTVLTGIIWIFSAILVGMRENMFLVAAIAVCFVVNILMTRPCIVNMGMNGASVAQIVPHSILLVLMAMKILISTGASNKKERADK